MKKFILFISLVIVQVVVARCVDCWERSSGDGCCPHNQGQKDPSKTGWAIRGYSSLKECRIDRMKRGLYDVPGQGSFCKQ
jgi:hypothetical protein